MSAMNKLLIEHKFEKQLAKDPLYDLYTLFRQKLNHNMLAIHPYRWLVRLSEISFKKAANISQLSMPYLKIGDAIVTNARELGEALNKNQRTSETRFYLASEYFANEYLNYKPKGENLENAIKDQIAESDKTYQLEVITKIGRIDCLSNQQLMEVKHFRHWKEALGHVIAYSHYYPKMDKGILLYGEEAKPKLLQEVIDIAKRSGIKVVYKQLKQ